MGLNVILEGELIFFCLFLKLTGVFESDFMPAAIGNWRILDVVEHMFVELDSLGRVEPVALC